MHTNHARAYAESYIGLVEVGVGLIPAGGGCKELLVRLGATVEMQKAKKTGGPFTPTRRAFETISFATVSTSAVEAQDLRFLRKSDAITVNRDLLLRDAKADALRLADAKEAGLLRTVDLAGVSIRVEPDLELLLACEVCKQLVERRGQAAVSEARGIQLEHQPP